MALEAARYDLVIEQGSDLWLALAFKDPAGNLIDTTGYTARAIVRQTYDGAAKLTMTTENGRITTGIQGTAPDQWNVTLYVAGGNTATMTDFGVGVWDLKLIDPSGNPKRVMEGAAVVSLQASY